MQYKNQLLLLFAFFCISVLIRLPHFNRPLSKHHEFNPAVILLGLESWKQGGGAAKFHFVPLLTYQNPADKVPFKAPYVDQNNNAVYLSFGPGWYVIPYIIFTILDMPFSAFSLQLLNLCFLIMAVVLLFRLASYLSVLAGYRSAIPAIGACFVFLFNPSILWFMGNGWVCTGIVLPFLILIIHSGLKMLLEPHRIKWPGLTTLFLAGIASIYIDWYGVCFLAAVAFASLMKIRQNKKYILVFFVSAIAIFSGVIIIALQFASYLGWEQVVKYWTSRYQDRGFSNIQDSEVLYVVKIGRNLATSFLPAVLALIVGYTLIKKTAPTSRIPAALKYAVLISFGACVINTLLFLNWAGEHDFGVIPYILGISLFAIWPTGELPGRKYLAWLGIFIFTASVVQYYFINYPGKQTASGFPYSSYETTGKQIAVLTSRDERIFSNSPFLVYQYYAKRNFTRANNYQDAIQLARKYKVDKWVWIKIREKKDGADIEEFTRSTSR